MKKPIFWEIGPYIAIWQFSNLATRFKKKSEELEEKKSDLLEKNLN
ncbi:hypothetical protein N9581_00485 [Amylibacter sp.]|nr:hypothetical protein [Amylibacter sp.]